MRFFDTLATFNLEHLREANMTCRDGLWDPPEAFESSIRGADGHDCGAGLHERLHHLPLRGGLVPEGLRDRLRVRLHERREVRLAGLHVLILEGLEIAMPVGRRGVPDLATGS